jgi:hypothetical protein
MGIKAVILYDPKTKDVIHFIHDGPGDPPPYIPPKMIPQRKRGRPRKKIITGDYNPS